MAGLTFLQLQDAVLSDRFREAQRGDCKNWINFRYWWLWQLEEWTFRYATAQVSVSGGSSAVGAVPVDFQVALALIRSLDGCQLDYLPPVAFFESYRYQELQGQTGIPDSYTILNGQLFVGPNADGSHSDYLLVYEREFTPLVADTDVPLLPAGAHFGLVHGGAAEGLKLQNDPTWQAFEQDFQQVVQVLQRGYLADRRGPGEQFGLDPIAA